MHIYFPNTQEELRKCRAHISAVVRLLQSQTHGSMWGGLQAGSLHHSTCATQTLSD